MKRAAKAMFFLIFALVLAWAPAASAAPAMNGVVTDEAKAFSPQDAASMEKELSGQKYGFRVLAIRDLEGKKSIADYAQSAFSEWKLGSQDALFVLWLNEKGGGDFYIQTLDNGTVNRAVKLKYPADGAFTRIYQENFLPSAKERKYAEGILKTAKAISALEAPAAVPAAPAKAQEAPKAAPQVSAASEERDPQAAEAAKKAILWSLSIIVFLGAASAGGFLAAARMRRAAFVREKLRETGEAYSSVNAGAAIYLNDRAEGLQNFGGELKQASKELQEKLSALLSSAGDARIAFQAAEESGVSFFNCSRMEIKIEALERDFAQCRQDIERCEHLVSVLSKADFKLKAAQVASEVALSKAKASLLSLKERAGVDPLLQLQSVDAAEAALSEASEQGKTEPSEARKKMETQEKNLSAVVSQLESLNKSLAFFDGCEALVASVRKQIAAALAQEGASAPEAFEPLDRIGGLCAHARASVPLGAVPKVEASVSEIENLVLEARRIAQSLLYDKKRAEKSIRESRSRLEEAKRRLEFGAQGEREKLRSSFALAHWKDFDSNLADALLALKEGLESLSKAEAVQAKDQESVNRLSELASVSEASASRVEKFCSGVFRFDSLEKERASLKRSADSLLAEAENAARSARRENLPQLASISFKLDKAESLLAAARAALSDPCDLGKAQSLLDELRSACGSIQKSVESDLSAKRDAERKLKDLMSKRNSKSYRSSVVSKHGSSYSSRVSDAERHIQNGSYADAFAAMAIAQTVVDSMDRDNRASSGGSSYYGSDSSTSYDSGGGGSFDGGSSGGYDSGGGGSFD